MADRQSANMDRMCLKWLVDKQTAHNEHTVFKIMADRQSANMNMMCSRWLVGKQTAHNEHTVFKTMTCKQTAHNGVSKIIADNDVLNSQQAIST